MVVAGPFSRPLTRTSWSCRACHAFKTPPTKTETKKTRSEEEVFGAQLQEGAVTHIRTRLDGSILRIWGHVEARDWTQPKNTTPRPQAAFGKGDATTTTTTSFPFSLKMQEGEQEA